MLSEVKDVKCAVKLWMNTMMKRNRDFTMNVTNADTKKFSMQREVKYEVRYGRVCITPCYLIANDNGNRPMIGSGRCQMCSNFRKVDKENRTVTCRCNPRPTFRTNAFKESRQEKVWKQQKIVECIETGEVYTSLIEASKALGLTSTTIGQCARYGRKTRNGYSFRYLN